MHVKHMYAQIRMQSATLSGNMRFVSQLESARLLLPGLLYRVAFPRGPLSVVDLTKTFFFILPNSVKIIVIHSCSSVLDVNQFLVYLVYAKENCLLPL